SLLSETTRGLDASAREAILARYYTPWRDAVREHLAHAIARGDAPALHLSVHSFTPVLDGKMRTVEVGLLFDPARARERAFCDAWRRVMERDADAEGLRVRMNAPYRGTSDGHTTALRGVFGAARYLGIEVEVNNALLRSRAGRERIGGLLARTLRVTLGR